MSIDRREALALLLLPALFGARRSTAASSDDSRRILVIGAGISGLKAARDLADVGFEVTVLEARDRLGGRIWTDTSLGVPIDLGASWIHGIRRNPIHALARQLDVELFEWDFESVVTYNTSGQEIDLSDAQDTLEWQFFRRARRMLRRSPRASVRDLVDDAVEDGDFDNLSRAELDFVVRMVVEQGMAAEADRISLASMLEGCSFGGAEVVFPKGYSALLEPLARGLDIRLGERVQRISHDARGVRVTTDQATHAADYAVITLPLGVLKSDAVTFEPALPSVKQRAIQAMDMAVLNKTYLEFPRVFWDRDVRNITRVGQEKGAWCYWGNLADVTGKPILLALNAASFGTQLESLSDDAIEQQALSALRSMIRGPVPDPVGRQITRWRSDPFAGGSYSFIPTEATTAMRSDLAAPVDGRLFFAGEATHPEHPSTVHGAFLTGKRVAREVLWVT